MPPIRKKFIEILDNLFQVQYTVIDDAGEVYSSPDPDSDLVNQNGLKNLIVDLNRGVTINGHVLTKEERDLFVLEEKRVEDTEDQLVQAVTTDEERLQAQKELIKRIFNDVNAYQLHCEAYSQYTQYAIFRSLAFLPLESGIELQSPMDKADRVININGKYIEMVSPFVLSKGGSSPFIFIFGGNVHTKSVVMDDISYYQETETEEGLQKELSITPKENTKKVRAYHIENVTATGQVNDLITGSIDNVKTQMQIVNDGLTALELIVKVVNSIIEDIENLHLENNIHQLKNVIKEIALFNGKSPSATLQIKVVNLDALTAFLDFKYYNEKNSEGFITISLQDFYYFLGQVCDVLSNRTVSELRINLAQAFLQISKLFNDAPDVFQKLSNKLFLNYENSTQILFVRQVAKEFNDLNKQFRGTSVTLEFWQNLRRLLCQAVEEDRSIEEVRQVFTQQKSLLQKPSQAQADEGGIHISSGGSRRPIGAAVQHSAATLMKSIKNTRLSRAINWCKQHPKTSFALGALGVLGLVALAVFFPPAAAAIAFAVKPIAALVVSSSAAIAATAVGGGCVAALGALAVYQISHPDSDDKKNASVVNNASPVPGASPHRDPRMVGAGLPDTDSLSSKSSASSSDADQRPEKNAGKVLVVRSGDVVESSDLSNDVSKHGYRM
jgi:hypothetical protein